MHQNAAHLKKKCYLKKKRAQQLRFNTYYLHKYTYLTHPFDFFAFEILQKLLICRMVSLWYESWY